MATFTVFIEGFGELPVTPAFVPRVEFNKRPNGVVQSIREIWPMRGLIPVVTATGADGLKAKRDSIIEAFKKNPATIEFRKDGTAFEKINASTHLHGAYFRNFDVRET